MASSEGLPGLAKYASYQRRWVRHVCATPSCSTRIGITNTFCHGCWMRDILFLLARTYIEDDTTRQIWQEYAKAASDRDVASLLSLIGYTLIKSVCDIHEMKDMDTIHRVATYKEGGERKIYGKTQRN